jgi:hypothetical protein
VVLFASAAHAQVRVGVEFGHESSAWHFDAPSSYDTADLVPHFFEQHYTLDNMWLTLAAAYRAGIDWRTTLAGTPVRRGTATDYDTFFNPDGITWVSGTSGDARMHSLRFEQSLELGRAAGLEIVSGYRLRVDLADFLDGLRTDSRNGVVASSAVVTTRELTNGQSHELFLRASHGRALGKGWQVHLAGDVSPTAVHRLAIRLPDKYPGQTLVYRTTSAATTGELNVERAVGGWPLTISVEAGRTWNYRSKQRVRRAGVSVGVAIGRSW